MSESQQIVRSRRTVVIGNSGSGKSTFAGHLAAYLHMPAIDLDELHWEDAEYNHKRDEAAARRLAAETAAAPRWIIEGVYGWLASEALPRATALVWLDLPWAECEAGLLARGPRRGSDKKAFDELLLWAREYWTRSTSSSFAGHQGFYDAFVGAKLRLHSRSEIHEFLADH